MYHNSCIRSKIQQKLILPKDMLNERRFNHKSTTKFASSCSDVKQTKEKENPIFTTN